MPVSAINATSREINGYPKINKNKLHNESMGTKKISTMLSGKKHQNKNEFIYLFILFIQCFKRVTRLASSAILPCGPLYNNYVHIYKQSNEHKQYIFS